MDYVQKTLARYDAGDKPIWITEIGYPSDPAEQREKGLNDPRYWGPIGQAAWLRDYLPMLLSFGVEKIYWFKLFDSDKDRGFRTYGLLDYYARPSRPT